MMIMIVNDNVEEGEFLSHKAQKKQSELPVLLLQLLETL